MQEHCVVHLENKPDFQGCIPLGDPHRCTWAAFELGGMLMKRILVLLLVLVGTSAVAQQTGSIVGTVHDPTGAVVPEANVKITNTETQFQRVVKTNASGEYVAPSMPTGTYSITVDKTGFEKLNRAGIILTSAT